jgi:hypothetical protein
MYYVVSKKRDHACARWREPSVAARQFVTLPGGAKCGIPDAVRVGDQTGGGDFTHRTAIVAAALLKNGCTGR